MCLSIAKGFTVFGLIISIVGLWLMISSAESEKCKNGNGKSIVFYNLHRIKIKKFNIGFGLVVLGNIFQIIGVFL